jgi:hypothetical protein
MLESFTATLPFRCQDTITTDLGGMRMRTELGQDSVMASWRLICNSSLFSERITVDHLWKIVHEDLILLEL